MAISGIRTGETGISLALDNNFMEPIATTLVGSGGVNQVTFLDIPQTYKHLQVRYMVKDNRGSAGDDVRLFYNSDTASTNYYYHRLIGTGASVFGQAVANESGIGLIASTTSIATETFGVGIIDVLDYTNTSKNKTTRSLSGWDSNGSGNVALYSTLWSNTAAITNMTFQPANGTLFQQYSRFSLYGVKG